MPIHKGSSHEQSEADALNILAKSKNMTSSTLRCLSSTEYSDECLTEIVFKLTVQRPSRPDHSPLDAPDDVRRVEAGVLAQPVAVEDDHVAVAQLGDDDYVWVRDHPPALGAGLSALLQGSPAAAAVAAGPARWDRLYETR
eukprot:gene4544-biopygen6190